MGDIVVRRRMEIRRRRSTEDVGTLPSGSRGSFDVKDLGDSGADERLSFR